jgi:integrase/recombinase XerD
MDVFKKLLFDMQLCGMSAVTQKNYIYHVRRFEKFIEKPIHETGLYDVRQFLHHLRNERKLNIGTVNYYHTCLKFLFQMTLEKEWNDWKVPRLRGYRALPAVMSRKEVDRLLSAVENLKHRTILTTVYSGGLRVSEVCRLKVSDIDSNNMQIFIRGAKGNKDRYTILSKRNLLILREYWKSCGKPKGWLFPGDKAGRHITPSSVRAFLKSACQAAGIKKKVTVHTLRHCFSTHMLEAGVSIFAIKVMLGHSSITSTCRYLHMVRQDAFNIKSPLDILDGDDDA